MRNRRIGIGIRIRRRAPRPRLDRIRRVVPSNAELVKTSSRSLSLMLDRQLSWNAVLHRCFQDRSVPPLEQVLRGYGKALPRDGLAFSADLPAALVNAASPPRPPDPQRSAATIRGGTRHRARSS